MQETIRLPEVAALELTYRCNHQCLFCSCPWEDNPRLKKEELTLNEWKNVISTIVNSGVTSITLTGGEPLLREDLKDIIDFIIFKKISLNMISNGRKIDDDFLDFIADRNISICISVPGIETFAEHTGIDNIEHVLSLFEKTKARGIHATANIAVTKKNLNELYENISYALIKGADYILLNRFLPGGRGLKNTEFLLSIDETNLMLDMAEKVLAKANRQGHVGTELPLCVIKEPQKYKHIHVSNLCAAGKGFFVVDPSGYIKVCNHSPQRICHYTEITKLAENEYWNSFVNRDYLPDMCKNCENKGVCDGGCREAAHVFNGSIAGNDPLFN